MFERPALEAPSAVGHGGEAPAPADARDAPFAAGSPVAAIDGGVANAALAAPLLAHWTEDGEANDAVDAGAALPADVRSSMEARLGSDLSAVRVHTGREAAVAADGHDADAFTVGSDVYFGAGAYDPGSHDGDALLAHELAHTIQAMRAPALAGASGVSHPEDPAEKEAERVAESSEPGRSQMTSTHGPAPSARVMRAGRRGERGRTGRPDGTDSPFKKMTPVDGEPTKVWFTDADGKKVKKAKPPGFDEWWAAKRGR